MKVNKNKKPVVKLNTDGDIKIKFKFSKSILNLFIGYAFSDSTSISKMNLSNLNKLLEMTDERTYEIDTELYARLKVAKSILDAKLHKGLDNKDAILSYCSKESDKEISKILSRIDEYTNLKQNEIKFITNSVVDRLQYSFLVLYKEIIVNEFMRIDTGEYDSFKEIVESVKDKCGLLMNDIRKADMVNSNMTFSLKDEIFDSLVTDTVVQVANPSTALVTGIKMLNDVLSPGYIQGRLYLWLG